MTDSCRVGDALITRIPELRWDDTDPAVLYPDLDAAALARPCGPAEGPFAAYPMAALVLHINREVIHHGAEVALLRDLYRARTAGS